MFGSCGMHTGTPPQSLSAPFPVAREHFLYFELMVAPRAGWFQALQIYLHKIKKRRAGSNLLFLPFLPSRDSQKHATVNNNNNNNNAE